MFIFDRACGWNLLSALYLHHLFAKGDLLKYTAHLRCIMKSVRPCTLFMANFGKAEISLLFKPAASVPLLKILNVS